MSDERLISADSHVNEPPEMFAERVPASLRDRAPRVEEVALTHGRKNDGREASA